MAKLLQRKAKAFISSLPRRGWFLQRCFFWSTFYNVRLFFPLEYLLLRELINCKSVLDLGCGRHSMVPILPKEIYTVGVELFEPYLKEAVSKGRHTKYIKADVTQVEFKEKSFDAVVILDVLEHLTETQGDALIEKMERWAKKKVIIFTPNGYFGQEVYDGNPYQEHKCGWVKERFDKMGYRVWGVRGFKGLRKKRALDRIVDITQALTYFLPNYAFQLFCVKNLNSTGESDGRR